MEPVKFSPLIKDYIWGGTRLNEFGKGKNGQRIAESWEICYNDSGESVVSEGRYKGFSISRLIDEKRDELSGNEDFSEGEFPLFIKLIDASKDLSIQVHPDDEMARKLEKSRFGKTEAWYIMEAEEGAEIVLGLSENADIERIIDNPSEIEKIVKKIKVSKGDLVYVPAGTVHAIGKGIMVAEIQQNSNITYRVYDYGRNGIDGRPRELNTEKAVKAVKSSKHEAPLILKPDAGGQKLVTDFFSIDVVKSSGNHTGKNCGNKARYLMAVQGEGKLFAENYSGTIKKGETVLIPASLKKYEISGEITFLEITT